MRLCVADGEREQHKQLMDNLERRLHANHIVFWLRENYVVGTSGSLSKRSVYNHYLNVTKQVTKKPLISPTFFGKLVKRAFPQIKCNRKGPRGHTKQHYTHLQRISNNQEDERAFPTGDDIGLLPTSPSDSDCFGSPCSPDAKMFLNPGTSASISYSENDEMNYLSCLMPHTAGSAIPMQQPAMTTPASPGGTASRSTSPTQWMFLSNPASTEMIGGEQPPVSHSQPHAAPSTVTGCLYCDQCQQASKGSVNSVPAPVADDATFIKQEPLSWLPEEMTAPVCAPPQGSFVAQSCAFSAYPTSYPTTAPGGYEQPLYTALTGPSSPPSVEIALPLEDDWTAFLLDN